MIFRDDHVQIASAKLALPRYGLGTAHINKAPAATAVATVEAAYEAGVRFFDTAPLYGSGRAEISIGEALAGVPRDSYVLATKVGRLVQPDGRCVFDFSRDGIRQSFEQSLERLKLDRVDIVHIHDPDDHFQQALDEAYPLVAELRSEGVVKAIGAGMNQWQMLQDFSQQADFDCFLLAGRYTLLEQTSLDFLRHCQQRDIAIIAGGIYNSGILVRELSEQARYNYDQAPAEVLAKARQIAALCQQHGVALSRAALHFPYLHPAISAVVIGAEAPAEVSANIAMLNEPVPTALWAALKEAGLIDQRSATP